MKYTLATLMTVAFVSLFLAACAPAAAPSAPAASAPKAAEAPTTAPAAAAPTAAPKAAAPTAAPTTAAAKAADAPTAVATKAAAGAAPTQGALTKVTIAMGFAPNMQFAPYYVAADKGYYAQEGLDVQFQHGQVQDLLKLVADGQIPFAITSGDALMRARAAGIPVTYILRQFTKYPVGALALSDPAKPLKTPSDLKGRTVGISGPGSSTDMGLKALQKAAGLTDADMTVTNVGFAETEALTQKHIDVAMTYLPNESAQMKAQGFNVDTLQVSPYVDLVSTGLATGENTIKNNPEVVQKFVRATLRGLKDMQADPNAAFASSLKQMPEVTPDKQPSQKAVLDATLEFETPVKDKPLGWIDPQGWKATYDFLKSINMLQGSPDLESMYTNRFVEAAKQ
ncbi:MAG: ABC transporter substrate-binding protein [Anaerolineae bacterium]